MAQIIKNLPATQETWVWPWIGKILWRRARQPTPVFLPGESPWREEPGGLQSMRSQRIGHNWATKHSISTRRILNANMFSQGKTMLITHLTRKIHWSWISKGGLQYKHSNFQGKTMTFPLLSFHSQFFLSCPNRSAKTTGIQAPSGVDVRLGNEGQLVIDKARPRCPSLLQHWELGRHWGLPICVRKEEY